MGSRNKRPHLALETPENTESSSSSDSEESLYEDGVSSMDQELQVEFEARTPEASDFPGISRLLQQTFRKSDALDISSLTNFIINQRHIGSVITQSRSSSNSNDPFSNNHELEDDDEEEDDLENEVFGILTLVPLKSSTHCPHLLSSQILEILKGFKGIQSSSEISKFHEILEEPSNSVSLIISERIINIPAQISVPLYGTLQKELTGNSAPFTHFILISKVYIEKLGVENKDEKAEKYFFNAEEEVLLPECDYVIPLEDEGEPVLRSNWSSDTTLTERRSLCLFKAEKMDTIVKLITQSFPIPSN